MRNLFKLILFSVSLALLCSTVHAQGIYLLPGTPVGKSLSKGLLTADSIVQVPTKRVLSTAFPNTGNLAVVSGIFNYYNGSAWVTMSGNDTVYNKYGTIIYGSDSIAIDTSKIATKAYVNSVASSTIDTTSLSNRINTKQSYSDTFTYDATKHYVDSVTSNITVNPAGLNSQIQFNDQGVFGASSNLAYGSQGDTLIQLYVGDVSATNTGRLFLGGNTSSNGEIWSGVGFGSLRLIGGSIHLQPGSGDGLVLGSTGAWTIGGSTGNIGDVMTSNGPGAEPTWQPASSGSGTFAGLTDVELTSLSDGQFVKYDNGSGKWVNFTLNAVSPVKYDASLNEISMPQADGATDGYLSSTDWNTFNNKLSSPANLQTQVTGTLPVANGGTGNSTLITTSTASTIVAHDANANLSADNILLGYQQIVTAGATTTLTVNSPNTTEFTGSTVQTVLLPVTSTLVMGQPYTIINNSTGIVTVQSSGANTVSSILGGHSATFKAVNLGVTTAAGWYSDYNVVHTTGNESIAGGKTFTTAITVSAAGTSTIGNNTANTTVNIASGASSSGMTKTVNMGTSGLSGSTVAINIGTGISSGSTATLAIGTASVTTTTVSGAVKAPNLPTGARTDAKVSFNTSDGSLRILPLYDSIVATGNTTYSVLANVELHSITFKPTGNESIKIGTTSGGTEVMALTPFTGGATTTVSFHKEFGSVATTIFIQGASGSVNYHIRTD